MPHFDQERFFRAASEQDRRDLLRMQEKLKRRKKTPEEQLPLWENPVLQEMTPDEQREYRRWEFARHLVREGKLSEWPDCCQTAGIARLTALMLSLSSSSSSSSASPDASVSVENSNGDALMSPLA